MDIFFGLDPYFVKVGIGYVMSGNVLFEFSTNHNSGIHELKKIDKAKFDPKIIFKKQPYANSDAQIVDPPPLIIDYNNVTFYNLDKNFYTQFNLPKSGQILYSNIAGSKISVSDEDALAINFSLNNEGCTLYSIIENKHQIKNKLNRYIRVTFTNKFGNSPGHPFVFEIWPSGHSSPIHNHGDTVAIIKILHGSLDSEWFNPIPDIMNEEPQLIGKAKLFKGQITWLSNEYYQTHRLENKNKDSCAISLQSYAYLENDNKFQETFNYILSGNKIIQKSHPSSDIHFFDMIQKVKDEFQSKSCVIKPGSIYSFFIFNHTYQVLICKR